MVVSRNPEPRPHKRKAPRTLAELLVLDLLHGIERSGVTDTDDVTFCFDGIEFDVTDIRRNENGLVIELAPFPAGKGCGLHD